MTRALVTSAQAASSPAMRVRAGLPSRGLSSLGVAVDPLPLFSDAEYRILQRAPLPARLRSALRARRGLAAASRDRQADVAWILRQADMLPSLSVEREIAAGRRLVYDVDDAIWFQGRGGGGHPLAFLKASKRKARWLATRADQVIAGNEILAEWLSSVAQNVTVVPSVVDMDDLPRREHADRGTLVIGWIGSPTTAAYLGGAVPAIEEASRAMPRVEISLLVVGGLAPAIRGVRCIQRPWSEFSEREALSAMDVGVMPLPENSWTRGKCAYKAIQYMASGIPVIAADVGVTRRVVGEGGVVTNARGDWVDALVTFARDANLRAQVGGAGRDRAAQDFSVERWVPTLARLLSGG